MSRIRGPLALLAAFVIQLGLSDLWPATVVLFDLPLLAVLYYALNRGPTAGMILGGAVGLLQDALTGSLFGAGALSRCLAGYLAGTAVMRFVLSGPVARLLVVAAATLATRLIELFTLTVMGRNLVTPSVPEILAGVAGNAILGTFLFSMFRQEKAV